MNKQLDIYTYGEVHSFDGEVEKQAMIWWAKLTLYGHLVGWIEGPIIELTACFRSQNAERFECGG